GLPVLDTSVYVHFPWCAKKCPYCDFATRKRAADAIPHEPYADALLRELALRGAQDGRRLVSVFFGGGTPSLWSGEALGRVLEGVRGAFSEEVAELEVTAECNPQSLTAEKARAFAAAGVNRLSVGVQSLRNDQLAFLGRLHDREEALRGLADARAAVPRVSADLMFGMPKQKALEAEVDAVLATGVEHVSAYSLTIEPGTQFGELQRLGRLEVAPDDDVAAMFEATEARFAAAGYAHYEVSNYARPGAEARHNQHYWRGGDYLALGAAAVGCLSEGSGARRSRNVEDGDAYLEAVRKAEDAQDVEAWQEALGPEERIQEALMLGLRTSEGVDLEALALRVRRDPLRGRERALDAALEAGDLVREGARLRVPTARWLRLDGIVARLF
ncbi:MAG: radical SAM family heme chaperone HemW, partial [Myxococcota bacterium]